MSPARDLRSLPKAHLHIHLEGAMRPETLRELAATDGVEVPPVRDFKGFAAFAGLYVAACDLLSDEARLRRVVREVVEDAAADGVTWIEPTFYSPRYAEQFGSDEAVIDIVIDELRASGRRLGVAGGVIVSADRTVDPDEAVHLAKVAARFAGKGVIGFGLANDETGHPPEPFAPAFSIARDAGLLSVPHGGELEGPESIVACLDECGADRVMHGVRAVESPDLMKRLADEGVCLDVCPTSNVLLSVVSRVEEHPLPRLLDAGIRCSLNADDPLLFGPGILEEYELCRQALGLDDETLAGIAACSFESSGAPEDLIAESLVKVASWLPGAARPGSPDRSTP